MEAVRPDEVTKHNGYQRHYFEAFEQPTLKPTDSLYLRRHVDAMMAFASIEPGDRVLEVGCGMGRYTLILAERGVRVEGLDLSPQLLEKLAEHNDGRYEIPLHGFDLLQAPAKLHERFDAVIGFFVLHHVHDVEASLAVAGQLVRPGGRLAFLEPNPFNPLYYVQILLTREMTWEGEKGMTRMRPKYLYPALRGAGVAGVSYRRFGFFPPFVTNRRLGARLESALEKLPVPHGAHPFQLFGGERDRA